MKREKRRLRRVASETLEKLDDDYLRSADSGILENLTGLKEYEDAKTIFCYVSIGREPDTRGFINRALADGKRVCIPKCYEMGHMEAMVVNDLDNLEKSAYGTMEPVGPCEKAAPEEIDLALIPCVSCWRDGRRLGHGGGFYDFYLKRADFSRVVICREKQMLEEIPHDRYDVDIPIVVSEEGVYRTGGR